MKNYYIYIENQQQGPFSFEELKEKKLLKNTLVWFEGIEGWIEADSVEELKELFKSVPPPIEIKSTIASVPPVVPPPVVKQDFTTAPSNNIKEVVKDSEVVGNKNPLILAIIGAVVLLVIGFFVYNQQQAKESEIEGKLQEQEAKINEQEQIENARKEAEARRQAAIAKQQREEELIELNSQYDQAVTSLRLETENLKEIEKFQLLRTSEEKETQLSNQLETIRYWENEVTRLEKEIKRYE